MPILSKKTWLKLSKLSKIIYLMIEIRKPIIPLKGNYLKTPICWIKFQTIQIYLKKSW